MEQVFTIVTIWYGFVIIIRTDEATMEKGKPYGRILGCRIRSWLWD